MEGLTRLLLPRRPHGADCYPSQLLAIVTSTEATVGAHVATEPVMIASVLGAGRAAKTIFSPQLSLELEELDPVRTFRVIGHISPPFIW